MENLTKENFFNLMTEKYPLAMADFCKWIDKYKIDNNWLKLFNEGYKYEAIRGDEWETKAPKFHDLPLTMQIGILGFYFMEHTQPESLTEEGINSMIGEITEEFKTLDYKLYLDKYPQYVRTNKEA